MIIGICGLLGQGKTLFLTRIGYYDHKEKRTVKANYMVSFGELVNPRDLLEFELENCTLLLDEINTFLDSRVSGEAERYLDYFFLQSRKRNVSVIYTAQMIHMVDRRLREITDIFFRANKTNKGFTYERFLGGYYADSIDLSMKEAKQIFKLYDTRQVIMPIYLTQKSTMTIQELEKIFNDSVSKNSFKMSLRSVNPWITLDRCDAVYDYLKNGKSEQVVKLLRL